jgi:glycosyltransferase involved in cell wall biosynthesis
MAAGAPVAVSTKVNTWPEIIADGAGFLAEPTVDGTHSLLQQWLGASGSQLAAMSENARRSFRNRYSPRCMAPRLVQELADCGVRNSLTPENVSQ